MVIPVLSWFRAGRNAVVSAITPPASDDWTLFQNAMKLREQSPVTQIKGQARKDRYRIVHEALAANDGGKA